MQSTPDIRAIAKHELLAEVVRAFGEAKIKVTGDSMLPSVWPGDVLTIRRQRFDEWQPGQIAVFLRDSLGHTGLVAHRIIGWTGSLLLTQGANLRHPDAPRSQEELLGRVVSVTRNGRAVDTSFTTARKMGAGGLRRSDLLNRAVLRIGRA